MARFLSSEKTIYEIFIKKKSVKITKFQMTHQEKIYMEALKSFFLNDFLQNSEKTDEKVPQLPHQSDLKSYLGITMNQIIF